MASARVDGVGKVVEFLHAQEPLLGLDAPWEVHAEQGVRWMRASSAAALNAIDTSP
jgi:hypothetical protein